MRHLTTINKKFINYIFVFLILTSIVLYLISQITIENNINSIMKINEDKEITLVIDSSDAYFIKDNKSISFIINNKLYIVDNLSLINMPNNQFSIKINNKNLETVLQANTTLRVNINLGTQKLYNLFF